ncbi:tyrosyl-DNA phosphodiesterase I [Xylariaceae sp. FL1651]|nr:tyrosyl-DNA phosphodiesterase I [Xylariaceae sp. FL1651]
MTDVQLVEEQSRDTTKERKRKAESGLKDGNRKTIRSRQKSAPGLTTEEPTSPHMPMTYPTGALRITRTPGRKDTKNCVNLSEVIHKDHLKSACIYSFFIAEEELYSHLPLSHTSDEVPIYIGRDPNMDPIVETASTQAGIPFKEKVSRKQLDSLRPALQRLHGRKYGKNLRTFYAWASGSSHSKILLLVYPAFLRIVITSCNMMDIDTELGDNHWYIHDVPKLSFPKSRSPSGFEADILSHMEALGAPEAFIDSIRGEYDYSTVKVHLVTSVPGTCAGVKAEQHGLLRFRRVVKQLDLKLSDKEASGHLQLEVCTASVGNLTAKWLSGFHSCALGKDVLHADDNAREVPKLKLFYPTVQNVKSADQTAQWAASNIGCHTRPWNTAPVEVKRIFHHYESKDRGKLFHQKFILAYNPCDTTQLPYYIYVGSANLSQSAWGAIEHDKKGNEATSDKKLVKLTNFECGVLIPGNLIKDLLENGTKSWQEGIVPHAQTTKQYDLSSDKAWNDPRWVTGYREGEGSGSAWNF